MKNAQYVTCQYKMMYLLLNADIYFIKNALNYGKLQAKKANISLNVLYVELPNILTDKIFFIIKKLIKYQLIILTTIF